METFNRFAEMDRRILTYGGYFERFIERLTIKEQQKVKYGLLLLKSLDKIPTKFVKYVREGIYELRTEYNGNIFRVFLFLMMVILSFYSMDFRKRHKRHRKKR